MNRTINSAEQSSGALPRLQSVDDSEQDDCEDFFICVELVFGSDVPSVRQEYQEITRQIRHPEDDESTRKLFWPADLVAKYLAQLGIPSDPDCHQQPHDFARAFPLPLELDESKFEDMDIAAAEITVNRALFVIWVLLFTALIHRYRKAGLSGSDLTIEVMKKLRIATVWLANYFCGDERIRQASDSIDWFIFTAGCFDLETGNLIDRELPLQREFEEQGKRREIRQQMRKERKA
jgi:hypothetical protein